MRETIKFETDGKHITFFINENKDVPIVYVNMYTDAGHALLNDCEKLGCSPFHLVSVTNLQWDEELSPWPHEPVVSKSDRFTGKANQYLCCLTEKIIPYTEEKIKKPSFRVIAGYSMGGLFALYAPYFTDAFSRAVSASGSVWYPGFLSYVKEHDFMHKPDAIYLSVGDLESQTKNKFLSQTEHCTKELYSIYKSKAIDSIFELNSGNHYKDASYRLAKGVTWILK